jgi:hypothetical protein
MPEQSARRRILVAMSLIAGAAMLAGCAGPRPLSLEEQIWFDKATGPELVEFNRPAVVFDPYAPEPYYR